MYHSLIFNEEINTWDDWHLIPSSRPVVNPPEVKTYYVDIAGANGSIDLTESLTGYPLYKNRTGSWEFYVANDYWSWDVAYSTIMNYLHGRTKKIVLEDDPSFYYEGRLSVNEWQSNKVCSTIVIDYDVYPYKRDVNSYTDDWLWDPFDFEVGIINEFSNIQLSGSLTIVLINREEPIVPTITISGTESNVNLEFEGETYSLVPGKNTNPYVLLKPGENTLKFTGNATLNITFTGGSL